MTEMYRQGYNFRKEREFRAFFGGGGKDNVALLLEWVEKVAEVEKVEPLDLLDRLTEVLAESKEDQDEEPTLVLGVMVYDSDLAAKRVVSEGNARRTQPYFDARGNTNDGRISGR